jgi:hypothetical protein
MANVHTSFPAMSSSCAAAAAAAAAVAAELLAVAKLELDVLAPACLTKRSTKSV